MLKAGGVHRFAKVKWLKGLSLSSIRPSESFLEECLMVVRLDY